MLKRSAQHPKWLTNLGGNSLGENSHSEETTDILDRREIPWQVTGIACTIMTGNFYVLGATSQDFDTSAVCWTCYWLIFHTLLILRNIVNSMCIMIIVSYGALMYHLGFPILPSFLVWINLRVEMLRLIIEEIPNQRMGVKEKSCRRHTHKGFSITFKILTHTSVGM